MKYHQLFDDVSQEEARRGGIMALITDFLLTRRPKKCFFSWRRDELTQQRLDESPTDSKLMQLKLIVVRNSRWDKRRGEFVTVKKLKVE